MVRIKGQGGGGKGIHMRDKVGERQRENRERMMYGEAVNSESEDNP